MEELLARLGRNLDFALAKVAIALLDSMGTAGLRPNVHMLS